MRAIVQKMKKPWVVMPLVALLALGGWLAFKPGDFIELDLNKSIEAKVVGVPVFSCQYGTSAGKYALKIDRTLTGSNMSWLGDHNVS